MNIQEIRRQYPQYGDMTDAELSAAMHRKFYPDMPIEEFSAKVGVELPKPPPEPSFLNKLGRQVGLAGRYLAEGAATPFTMVGDAVNTGINAVAGTKLGMPSQALSQGLTEMGLPEPQTGLERIVAAPSRALAGVGGMAQLAKTLPALAPLGKELGIQAQGAIGGSVASEVAKEADAGPGGQLAAGVAGGLLTPGAIAASQWAARSGRELVRPLTDAGQTQIVGSAMSRMASDPAKAVEALKRPEMFVAGSRPTTAQASGDLGLLAAERAVQRQNPALFAEQQAANNAARLAELRAVAGPDDAIEVAKAARDAKALPILERAFEKAKPVNTAPVERLIYNIGNASKNPSLRNALGTIQNEIAGETNPRQVYEVRKLIDSMLDKSIPEHAALAKYGKTSLLAVKNELDKALNKATKNQFTKYLETYADMSKYVNRAQAGQQIVSRFDAAAVDASGNPIVSAYALKKAVSGVKNPVTKEGADSIFNVGEMDALQRVIKDLDRAGLSNNAVRAAGSDTFQNLATGNLVSRMLGEGSRDNTLMRTAFRRPLDFLYKPAEQKMQGMLGEGMLDPELGRKLLMQRMKDIDPVTWRQILERYSQPAIYGGMLGTAAP